MKFEQKTIKRSIRNLERLIAELKSAGIFVYQSRVREFITLIKTDEVLIHIVKPYLDMDIDVEEIENEQYGWYNLKLPINKDYQISYVLKTMESSSAGQFAMDMYAHKIFRQKRIMDNIFEWNKQLLFPCLLILQDKLNDLVEDKVEGKEEIEAQSLQIINYGSITAKQGNIAMGKDISQTMTLKRYFR
ncbi:hypothetical protein ACT7CZ_06820 [Bacillus cereus]